MTTGGLVFMLLSWGLVTALVIFCFSKVVRSR